MRTVDNSPVASKTPLLDSVRTPQDLRDLPEALLPQLVDELRRETIDAVSVTGGHLARVSASLSSQSRFTTFLIPPRTG